MKWRVAFYNERRGILANYTVDAPLPPAAVLAGWDALRAEHPVTPPRGAMSLLARADRSAGQQPGGWVLYRIAGDHPPQTAQAPAAPAPAAPTS